MREECRELERECGYLNFCNDIFDLWKKYNIESVMELDEALARLKEYDEKIDVSDRILKTFVNVISSATRNDYIKQPYIIKDENMIYVYAHDMPSCDDRPEDCAHLFTTFDIKTGKAFDIFGREETEYYDHE